MWPVVFLILTGWGAFLLGGGYAHYEGQFFLVNYLDGRDFFQHVFSAHHNEWDCYQGRELSFLFGWIDAQVIRFSARLGFAHLYSLTHYAGLLALAILLWRLLPRMLPGLSITQSGLIVSLFLSSPVASLSGYYYRPAKILAALMLVIVLRHAVNALSRQSNAGWKPLMTLVVSATLLGLTDRLGIFSILLIGAMLIVARPIDRNSFQILAALIVALALNGIWSTLLGPQLSTMADGYPPDVADQLVRLRHTFLDTSNYRPALSIWLDHIGFFLGNTGLYGTSAIAAASGLVLWKTRARRILILLGIGAAASLLLYVAMFARLESLVWPASRRVYYWLPVFVMIAIGAAMVVSRIEKAAPAFRKLGSPLLAILVMANLLALPSHQAAIRSQEHRPWILESAEVRRCIATPSLPIASFSISPEYAQVCSAVRTAAWGSAGEGGPAPVVNPDARLSCHRVANPVPKSS